MCTGRYVEPVAAVLGCSACRGNRESSVTLCTGRLVVSRRRRRRILARASAWSTARSIIMRSSCSRPTQPRRVWYWCMWPLAVTLKSWFFCIVNSTGKR
eukprot:2270332-Prymnesium_polylepis.1